MILAIFFGDLSNPNCKSKGFKGMSKYQNWLTKKTVFWGDFLGLKSVTTPVLFGGIPAGQGSTAQEWACPTDKSVGYAAEPKWR